MQILTLRPAPGRVVPDPERGQQPLVAEGRRVEITTYWQRRIDDNDVVVVEGNEHSEASA